MIKKPYLLIFSLLLSITTYAQEPVLTSSRPSSGDTDVAIVSGIYLYFDQTPTKGTGDIYIRYYDDDQIERTITNAYIYVTSQYVMLDIGVFSLPTNTHLYVDMGSGVLKSNDGNTDYSGLGKANFHFTTVATDATGPVVQSISPAEGATNVPKNQVFTITFDEPVEPYHYTETTSSRIMIMKPDNTTKRTYYNSLAYLDDKVEISGNSVILNPIDLLSVEYLDPSTTYHFYFTGAAFRNKNGVNNAGETNHDFWTFTTGPKPIEETRTPAHNATGVDLIPEIIVDYDIPISFASSTSQVLVLYKNGSVFRGYTPQDDELRLDGDKLYLELIYPLEAGATYSIWLKPGNVLSSTDFGADVIYRTNWEFTTKSTTYTPTDISLTTTTFSDDIGSGQAIATISGTDQDDNIVSYELTAGTGTAYDDFYIGGTTLYSGYNGYDASVKSDYNITITAIDADGNEYDKDFVLTAEGPDVVAPTLLSAGTLDDGTNESAILDFTLTFSEDVTISTAFNMFKLGYSNGNSINFSSYITGTTSNSVSFEYKYLTQGSNLHILIDPSAVTDLAGNAYAGITTSDVLPFTASWTEPEVTTYSPAKSETQVSVSSDLVLTFDRNIAFTAETGARIYLKTSSPIATVESFEITSDRISIQSGNQLVIDPTDDLDFNTRYFVTISPHSIMTYGDAGKTFAGFNSTLSWPFTSEFNYWDGALWADGTPGSTDNVTFKADYAFTADEVLEFNGVYIPAGVSLTIENNATLKHNSDLTSYGNITIESGSAINSQNNFFGQAGSSLTVKRNTTGGIGDGEYSFIGSPFYGYDFTSITGDFKYQYNQTNNTYVDASSLTSMISGRGYTIANNDVLEFTGTNPLNGNVNIGVQNSGEGFGYNLLANPYTAAISYDALMAAEGPDGTGKITATIYLWDDGGSGAKSQSDFITVNALGSVSGGSGRSGDFNDHIGVAQGFFVESTQTNVNLTFTNAMKVNGKNTDGSFFRTTEDSYETIKLALIDQTEVRSEILLGWVADAEAGYDTRYDSRKLVGNSASQIYMPLQDRKLAIQGLPVDHLDPIALAVDIKEAGTYQLTPVESTTGRSLLLHDKQLEVVHDLTEGAYQFHSSAGVFDSRFEILSSARVLSAELLAGTIYAYDKMLYIKATSEEESILTVFTLSGQQVMQRTVAGSQQLDLSQLQDGVYIVTKDGQSQKILLK